MWPICWSESRTGGIILVAAQEGRRRWQMWWGNYFFSKSVPVLIVKMYSLVQGERLKFIKRLKFTPNGGHRFWNLKILLTHSYVLTPEYISYSGVYTRMVVWCLLPHAVFYMRRNFRIMYEKVPNQTSSGRYHLQAMNKLLSLSGKIA